MYKTIPISSDGFLMSVAKAPPAEMYQNAIHEIITDILTELGTDKVRSIVLRGSIACHSDIPGISDLDLVIFMHRHSEKACAVLAELAAKETYRWKKLVSLVDLSCERFDTLTTDIFYNRLYLNIKLTGITLWGEDLISLLPTIPYDPTLAKKIARQTWLESLQTYELICKKRKVSFMGEERGCDFLCVWFMRSFCRGLISMVMLKRDVFSLHVQSCAQLFEEQFPVYVPLAKRCRELECDPTTDWEELKEITTNALEIYRTLCEEFSMRDAVYEQRE